MTGSLGGLALAFLLVLAVAFIQPQRPVAVFQASLSSMPVTSTSRVPTQSTSSSQVAPPTTAEGGLQAAENATPSAGPQSAATAGSGHGTSSSSSSSTTTKEAISPASSRSASEAPRSASLIVNMPGEGARQLAITFSPIIVGVVLAALLYGAYARRGELEDAS